MKAFVSWQNGALSLALALSEILCSVLSSQSSMDCVEIVSCVLILLGLLCSNMVTRILFR